MLTPSLRMRTWKSQHLSVCASCLSLGQDWSAGLGAGLGIEHLQPLRRACCTVVPSRVRQSHLGRGNGTCQVL